MMNANTIHGVHVVKKFYQNHLAKLVYEQRQRIIAEGGCSAGNIAYCRNTVADGFKKNCNYMLAKGGYKGILALQHCSKIAIVKQPIMEGLSMMMIYWRPCVATTTESEHREKNISSV